MSGWTSWLRITMPIFTSNDAMMLFEVLWKMDCRCTLEINWKGENSELDWEALNWMNEFISGGLRLNIFPLDERLKKKLFSLRKKEMTILANPTLWSEICMCYVYNEGGKTLWDTLGKTLSIQTLSFLGHAVNVKIKNILDWNTETWRTIISQESCRL